jgi:hypothetical protein
MEQTHGALVFSCIGRSFVLGLNNEAELAQVDQLLSAYAPYQMTYSGGEICPLIGSDGKWKNRFHNDTFTACVF